LQPAEVSRVVLDEDDHSMEVIVADDQLSLAIGRRGQNVKLASKISGWRIDVRSVTAAEEEAKQARASLERIAGLDFTMTELLYQEGFRSAREVAEGSIDDIADIEGFDLEKATAIVQAAKELVDSLPEEEVQVAESNFRPERRTDLDKLMLPNDIRSKLLNSGLDSIHALVEMEDYDLSVRAMLSQDDLARLRDATDLFLKSGAAPRLERAS
jgi:transcription termination factor NusA